MIEHTGRDQDRLGTLKKDKLKLRWRWGYPIIIRNGLEVLAKKRGPTQNCEANFRFFYLQVHQFVKGVNKNTYQYDVSISIQKEYAFDHTIIGKEGFATRALAQKGAEILLEKFFDKMIELKKIFKRS